MAAAPKKMPPWMAKKQGMKGACAKCGSKSHATAACKKK